jgi:hypothetical protein
MRELHEWYIRTSADGGVMFTARVKDSDLHRGLADVWIKFESLVSMLSRCPRQVSRQCISYVSVSTHFYSSSTISVLSHNLFYFVSHVG